MSPVRTPLVPSVLLACRLLLPSVPMAQQAPAWELRELAIPVRDGATLHAIALLPTGAHAPLPILLVRTPFGCAREFRAAEPPARYRELAADGYLFVCGDVRGRFGSEGTFVTLRAQDDPRSPQGVNESTDAYDTIDWLVRHLPGNDGKVGVLGSSYRGWLAALAGVGAHPALKAISPQAPSADTWMGDDFFHQGAFRQTQALAYSAWIEGQGVEIPDADQYAFYRRFPTLAALARAAGVDTLPTWSAARAHPAYDDYWRSRALTRVLTRPEVPMLFVGGFWDEEDVYGAPAAYRTVERADAKGRNHVVLGPWSHNMWLQPGGDSLGPVALGGPTADHFRASIERPWFAYWLHGRGDGRFPEAWVFETGANAWRTFDAWPPKGVERRRLYLRSHGALSFEAPAAGEAPAYDAYVSDPAHPVPYVPRPDDGTGWSTWLQQDQRFVDGRPDVRSWQTPPLEQDLVVAGDVSASLFASTSGTDADWVVKLIDVYPDTVPEAPRMGGHQLIVAADVLRGRYWKGFERPTPVPAGAVVSYTVDLHQQLYRFRRGHRIMVQVQSSWFPLYDRNPQTFVPNIFHARPSHYRAREHRVWHSTRRPSHVEIPVLASPAVGP